MGKRWEDDKNIDVAGGDRGNAREGVDVGGSSVIASGCDGWMYMLAEVGRRGGNASEDV